MAVIRARRAWRRWPARPRRPGGDLGSTSVELVIVFPALLLVVTALLQYGLWFHARSLAQAAAAEGVAAARVYGGTLVAGRGRAITFLDEHAGDTLVATQVTAVASGTDAVTVQVRGRALSILPWVAGPTVVQAVSGPVERFTTRSP